MRTKIILNLDDVKNLIVEKYNANRATIRVKYIPMQIDGIYVQDENMEIEFESKAESEDKE